MRVEFDDGSSAAGDLLIGADGLHSMVRDSLGGREAKPTGWCSWQGLITLAEIPDKDTALMVIGERGNLGLWPAGGSDVQWWFDLPWSYDYVRPQRPIETIRSHFTGWSEAVDRVLATLTDDDLAHSPYPHFRHPIPPAGRGPVTLLGDAAHTMPPTLAQGTNQALLDTMVLCKALSDRESNGDVPSALRRYEKTRRRRVMAVSRVASLPVSHGEFVLAPAALIPDRLQACALTLFLRWTSHRRMSAEISRELGAATTSPVQPMNDSDDSIRVRGDFDAPSRWLWLLKWCVLAVPHYPILIGLYLIYPLSTVVAGVAILFTGRYPRPIFDFNVGVLRWSWRVMNFRFPMNSTDRYPPSRSRRGPTTRVICRSTIRSG